MIITVNGTDNSKEIFNQFKRKKREITEENNELFSRIDGVNKFFLERRSVDIAIRKLEERIDCSIHSNHIMTHL